MILLINIKITKTAEGVRVQIKADIGFMNERVPQHFNNKLVYVCLFVETSDGRKVHFARMRYVCFLP